MEEPGPSAPVFVFGQPFMAATFRVAARLRKRFIPEIFYQQKIFKEFAHAITAWPLSSLQRA
jgi:hypothetical protein